MPGFTSAPQGRGSAVGRWACRSWSLSWAGRHLSLGLSQRAQDDAGQPRGPVLQDVIGGALLDELDRCFVAEHTGPEDERYVRVAFLGDLEVAAGIGVTVPG
jgi:hypothetical protein